MCEHRGSDTLDKTERAFIGGTLFVGVYFLARALWAYWSQ